MKSLFVLGRAFIQPYSDFHENRLAMKIKRRRTEVNEYVSDMRPFERNIEVPYHVHELNSIETPKAILMFHFA